MIKSTIVISLAASLLLVGCNATPATDSTSESSTSNSVVVSESSSQNSESSTSNTSSKQMEVIDKIVANNKIDSVQLELGFSVEDPSQTKKQKMTQDIQYNSNAEMTGLNLYINTEQKTTSDNKTSKDEVKMIYTPDSILWQQQNGAWTSNKVNANEINLNPEYYELTTQLIRVLDALEFKETATHYEFSYEGKDLALASLFEKTFSIQLTGVNDADLSKKLELKYNKESYLLESFDFEFTYSSGGESLKLDAEIDFSQYNKIDASKFAAPN